MNLDPTKPICRYINNSNLNRSTYDRDGDVEIIGTFQTKECEGYIVKLIKPKGIDIYFVDNDGLPIKSMNKSYHLPIGNIPEEKFVPWNYVTCPLANGSKILILKHKDSCNIYEFLSYDINGLVQFGSPYKFDKILEDWLYFKNDEWVPAGTKIPQ